MQGNKLYFVRFGILNFPLFLSGLPSGFQAFSKIRCEQIMVGHQIRLTKTRSSWIEFSLAANDGNLQEVFLGENQFPGGNHFTARSILHSVTRSTRPAICRFPTPAKFWLCQRLQKRISSNESKITIKLLKVLQDYLFATWTV